MTNELLQACQTNTLTLRQERDLGLFVDSICDRLYYYRDKTGVITFDDQRQAARFEIWKALNRGKYDPTKSDASITTYMTSIGNNSIRSLFRRTEKRKWYEDIIHLNRNTMYDKANATSTRDHEGEFLKGECLDSPFAYVQNKTPTAFQRRGMFLHMDMVEPEGAEQRTIVLLRATYVFDDLCSRVLNARFAGKKTKVISNTLNLPVREIQRMIREAKKRVLLLHELLQTFSFEDLLCIILRIQTEGCRVLDFIKRRSLVPLFFQLLTYGTKEPVKLPQNAVCYRSAGFNPDPEVLARMQKETTEAESGGEEEDDEDSGDADPHGVMSFETFSHLFSGLFPNKPDLISSEWCKAFQRHCPPEHARSPIMIQLYRGYVDYYRNNVTRLESNTLRGKRSNPDQKTDIQFNNNGAAYIRSVDTLFNYQKYIALFEEKLRDAELFDMEIQRGDKSTQFFMRVDNYNLGYYYDEVGISPPPRDISETYPGSTLIPLMSIYNPAIGSAKWRPDRLWITTAMDISNLEIRGPGLIRPTRTSQNWSVEVLRFKFTGSRIYEETAHAVFDEIIRQALPVHQGGRPPEPEPVDDGPVNTKNLFVLGD